MANPVGESDSGALRLDFDRRLSLQFRGCVVTSDAGLLAYRELDDALGLTALAGEMLADTRTGKNGRHALVGLLRQSVFGRLAGYEDVNDAERLRYDPAMRWIVGGKAAQGCGASPSQMGRFETRWLAADTNLSPLTDLCGDWIDLVHSRTPPRGIVLDMDSSVSPTHGVRCSCSTSSAIWNAAICDPATCTAPMAGTTCSSRSSCAIAAGSGASISGPMPPSPCRVSTSTWRLSTSNTRSGCPPTKCCRTGSATCSNDRSDGPQMASGRALSPGRLRRDQHEPSSRAGRRLLQQARHGRAVDQRRQGCDQVDAAVMPDVRCQRGASAASCARLQPWQLPAHAGDAGADQGLVAVEPEGEADQDRR